MQNPLNPLNEEDANLKLCRALLATPRTDAKRCPPSPEIEDSTKSMGDNNPSGDFNPRQLSNSQLNNSQLKTTTLDCFVPRSDAKRQLNNSQLHTSYS